MTELKNVNSIGLFNLVGLFSPVGLERLYYFKEVVINSKLQVGIYACLCLSGFGIDLAL